MSAEAALAGLPAAFFEFGGKRRPLASPDLQTVGLFTTWLEEQGLSAAHRHAHRLGMPVERVVSAWMVDVAAGEYAWESEASAKARRWVGSPGWRHWCWLLLNQADATAGRDLVDEAVAAGKAGELDRARAVAEDPLGRAGPASASPP